MFSIVGNGDMSSYLPSLDCPRNGVYVITVYIRPEPSIKCAGAARFETITEFYCVFTDFY